MPSLDDIWSTGVSLESVFSGLFPYAGKPTVTHAPDGHPRDAMYMLVPYEESFPEVRLKLTTGNWVALGFRAPRSLNSKLEIIPSELCLHADFEIKHSTISGDGLAYVGVRLVHHSMLEDLDTSLSHPGRPSRREEIIAAYRVLREAGEIDFESPLSRLYRPIQITVAARLGIEVDELKGVGAEAIRKTVRPLFDEDRSQKL